MLLLPTAVGGKLSLLNPGHESAQLGQPGWAPEQLRLILSRLIDFGRSRSIVAGVCRLILLRTTTAILSTVPVPVVDAQVVGCVGAVRVELEKLLDPDLGVGYPAAGRLLPSLNCNGLGTGGDHVWHHGATVPHKFVLLR